MVMISLALAGTTERTTQVAQTLFDDSRFSIDWILTPAPKPVGRKKTITANPLDQFAQENSLPAIYINTKIDGEVKAQIENLDRPDIILVIDFGYIVPKWLLKLPKIAPVNIHPSLLPRWRGSSPGQFVLLTGEKESGVSVIQMDEGLDTGPIIFQNTFEVPPDWDQTAYYQHSFTTISADIGNVLAEFINNNSKLRSQPNTSPTPIARQLTKQDSFISWEILQKALNGSVQIGELPELFQLDGNDLDRSLTQRIVDACRAFHPWPGLWTIIPTPKGDKRMKILKCKNVGNLLQLVEVQIEGKTPQIWNSEILVTN